MPKDDICLCGAAARDGVCSVKGCVCSRHEPRSHFIFVAVRKSPIVMRGAEFICRAISHNMAARIAAALNDYKPDRRGQ